MLFAWYHGNNWCIKASRRLFTLSKVLPPLRGLFLDVSVSVCAHSYGWVCSCQGKCADQSTTGGIACTLFQPCFPCFFFFLFFSDEYARLAGSHVQGVSCLHLPSFVGVLRLLAPTVEHLNFLRIHGTRTQVSSTFTH